MNCNAFLIPVILFATTVILSILYVVISAVPSVSYARSIYNFHK